MKERTARAPSTAISMHCYSADASGSNRDAALRTAETSSLSTSSSRSGEPEGVAAEAEAEVGDGGGESTLPAPSMADRNALSGSTTRFLSPPGREGESAGEPGEKEESSGGLFGARYNSPGYAW